MTDMALEQWIRKRYDKYGKNQGRIKKILPWLSATYGWYEFLSLALHLASNDNLIIVTVFHLVKQDIKTLELLLGYFTQITQRKNDHSWTIYNTTVPEDWNIVLQTIIPIRFCLLRMPPKDTAERSPLPHRGSHRMVGCSSKEQGVHVMIRTKRTWSVRCIDLPKWPMLRFGRLDYNPSTLFLISRTNAFSSFWPMTLIGRDQDRW